QDDVFRRAGQAVRADAIRAQGRARGDGPVQSSVLRLSEPADRGRECGGKVAVLNTASGWQEEGPDARQTRVILGHLLPVVVPGSIREAIRGPPGGRGGRTRGESRP